MADLVHLKYICMVLALFLFIHSIFSLVDKNSGEKKFSNQAVIISIIYMMMSIALFFAAVSVTGDVNANVDKLGPL